MVTETPPGTPNGFGVTLDCMFKNIDHRVLYTDASFKTHGDNNGYILGQVPFHRSRKSFFPFLLGEIPEWRSFFSSAWLKQNIDSFYSIIYVFVYSFECVRFAAWISKKKKIPLIIHLADHSTEFENPLAQKVLIRASKLVCISEEMKFKYEQLLGRKDIKVLHNGAESTCFNIPSPKKFNFSEDNPFRICFIGGLFSYLHGDCIEDIFEAIEILRVKNPWVEFHMYGQRQPTDFLRNFISLEGCYHHGVIMPLEKKFEIMMQASCFVIPSSFNEFNNSNYRYSFPTKLPELIACGRPILSYGPKNTATNRILKQHNIGIRLHQRSVENLTRLLLGVVENYKFWIVQAANQKTDYKNQFSAGLIREKFSKILEIA